MADPFSTSQLSPQLIAELEGALKKVDEYGSIEIYVQKRIVTQITVRNIKKTRQIAAKR
jgi:hypothetical protein